MERKDETDILSKNTNTQLLLPNDEEIKRVNSTFFFLQKTLTGVPK